MYRFCSRLLALLMVDMACRERTQVERWSPERSRTPRSKDSPSVKVSSTAFTGGSATTNHIWYTASSHVSLCRSLPGHPWLREWKRLWQPLRRRWHLPYLLSNRVALGESLQSQLVQLQLHLALQRHGLVAHQGRLTDGYQPSIMLALRALLAQ